MNIEKTKDICSSRNMAKMSHISDFSVVAYACNHVDVVIHFHKSHHSSEFFGKCDKISSGFALALAACY